jgi:hypothetical protein
MLKVFSLCSVAELGDAFDPGGPLVEAATTSQRRHDLVVKDKNSKNVVDNDETNSVAVAGGAKRMKVRVTI